MESLRPTHMAYTLIRRASVRPKHAPRTSYCANQLLHTTAAKPANPIPLAEMQGPPPPAPQPSVSQPEDRVLRKKKQAEMLARGRELRANPARPATTLRKRFWKDVSVKETSEGLQIYLDSRPVRTADKRVLTLPHHKHQLATALALEWDQLVMAHQALKHHYIPLTSLVSRALDLQEADQKGDTRVRDGIITMLVRYLNTDTLLCWASNKDAYGPTRREGGETLREMQMRVATPIISYLTSRVWPGVEINPVLEDPDSILPTPQPLMTQEVVRGWLHGLKAFDLAGLERAVLATKSLCVSMRLLVEWSQSKQLAALRSVEETSAKRFGIEEAAHACSLEVIWQTDQWGEVEDTHDVEKVDLRRQLGAAILLISGEQA